MYFNKISFNSVNSSMKYAIIVQQTVKTIHECKEDKKSEVRASDTEKYFYDLTKKFYVELELFRESGTI